MNGSGLGSAWRPLLELGAIWAVVGGAFVLVPVPFSSVTTLFGWAYALGLILVGLRRIRLIRPRSLHRALWWGVLGGILVLAMKEIHWRISVLLDAGRFNWSGGVWPGWWTFVFDELLLIVIVGSVAEEIFFREYWFWGIVSSGHKALAYVLTCGVFAMTHGPSAAVESLYLGVVTALLREHTDHIAAPIVAHVLVNAAITISWCIPL